MPLSRDGENMANHAPATEEAKYVALVAQVRGLDDDYKELKGIVVALDRKIETTSAALGSKLDLMVSGLGNKLEASVTGIQAKLDERSKIQWPALSVMVTALGLIGALVYWPIRETTLDLRDGLKDLAKVAVVSTRYESDRATLNLRISEIREVISSLRTHTQDNREAHARHDQAIKNHDARIDAISRRLAEHIRDVTRIDRSPR